MCEEHKKRQLSLQLFYFHVGNIESMAAKFTGYVKSHMYYFFTNFCLQDNLKSYVFLKHWCLMDFL